MEIREVIGMWLCTILIASTALAESSAETDSSSAQEPLDRITPLDGCAWVEQDGIRAAWLSYKQLDETTARHLRRAHVNAVFLKHGFHDLLDLNSARWEGNDLVVNPREEVLRRALDNTRIAAQSGIHVFWLANYELDQMLPHLKRLGYQQALAEGPGRYLRPGLHDDAAPLDSVFWRGITAAHGELVAKLSREHPIDGLIYDTEHYGGGIMYLNNAGFSDATFHQYVESRTLGATAKSVQAGNRYEFLKTTGLLHDYDHFLEEQAYLQGRELANRWHAVNPHLILGVWPLLDNWFSRGFLRGLGGAVPSLGLSGVEYYHGSDQSQSMADYFESRIPNCLYMPGFYPPYAYTVAELEHHVGQAIRSTKHFWMLGPHEELQRPEYQAALGAAFESASLGVAQTHPEVNLTYRVEQEAGDPYLIVRMTGALFQQAPRLSLWSKFGGAALCEKQPMAMRDGGYEARIPLFRRMTNNNGLSAGFRSGVSYRYDPTPQAFRYEDPHHTKLTDGRAYGYFGTTAAWPKSVSNVSVTFDLHRPYCPCGGGTAEQA